MKTLAIVPGATRALPVVLTAALAVGACGSAAAAGRDIDLTPVARLPYTEADVRFMSGMIPHHAQALLMAGWAATHGARNDVRILAERIVVGQRDEIALMQMWLRDRNRPVPDPDPEHMMHAGMDHDLMPGMLTAAELGELSRARGNDFDRLFLTYMIRHHEGAVTMVDELFAAHGAAQDEDVFRLASDIYADQTTEIDRMEQMLASLPTGGRP
ncbi:MAG TPA: DUF305 domain-containing protein [Longimicrobiales bacterium]